MDLYLKDRYIYFKTKGRIKALKADRIRLSQHDYSNNFSINQKAITVNFKDPKRVIDINICVLGPVFRPKPEDLKCIDKATLEKIPSEDSFIFENKDLHFGFLVLPH